MKDIQTIILEGEEYMLIGNIQVNGIEYMHFSRTDNPKDFCIRKVTNINGEEMIVGLDSKEEFDMALQAFSDKHIKDLEN